MKKYLMVMYLEILQLFTYRLSFILWRARNIFNLIFLYFLWTSVYSSREILFNYTEEKLIAYILIINLLSSIVMTTRTADIANDILSGDIMNNFLKPISFFRFLISKEVADKLFNLFFSVIEIVLLIIIFKPSVFIPTDLIAYGFFFVTLTISVMISFLISLFFSFLAFWSNEIWAPRFIYITLVSLLAGSFFPLDILPKTLYDLLLLTPFPYLVFLPGYVLIHGASASLIRPLFFGIIWCVVLLAIIKKTWRNGVMNYSAYGR